VNGWDFLEEQKKNPAWRAIPVVVISASEPHQAQAAALGVAAYLQKPVEINELTGTVHDLATSPQNRASHKRGSAEETA
jgi:CheY-like chemotaxis protein